ncbi:unnamed protein product [Didymodactylos carnosus]|uniref:Putative auto-transporter adhesin head GIN domain-containing protein n=1 Tax=Didymodactylos carnosus TaxID=1234261 RepID=A0A814FDY4_9BILA|nr:unnamed protein product [Didymodactylos carnosus]CAF3752044.1 unnamed protein product [Didymodactylos carnosus]
MMIYSILVVIISVLINFTHQTKINYHSIVVQSGSTPTIVGDKNVLRQKYLVARTFNKIYIDGAFNVYLTQVNNDMNSSLEGIEIETDKNIHDFIICEVTNDHILNIKMKPNVNYKFTDMIVYINYKVLVELYLNGIGNTETTNQLIQSEKLILHNEGTTSFKLNVSVPMIDAFIYSTGQGILGGSCGVTNIKDTGVGDVDASNLITQYVNVDASGVGKIKVYAIRECNIRAEGVSTVYYKCPIKKQETHGLAKIIEW